MSSGSPSHSHPYSHLPYNLLLSPTNVINNTNPITNKLKPMITPTNKITCLAFNSVMSSSVESNSLNNDLVDLLIITIKSTIKAIITICI